MKESLRDFLRPSLRGKIFGFFRRMSWRLREWWRGPIHQFEVGDVIEINGRYDTVEKVEGRTIRLSSGSTLTV